MVRLSCLHPHLQLLFLQSTILVKFADEEVSQILSEAIKPPWCGLRRGGLVSGEFLVALQLDVLQDV